MPGVVEEQYSILQKVVQFRLCERITLTRGIDFLWICVQVNLIDYKVKILFANTFCPFFRYTGMQSVITIVGEEYELCLPLTHVFVAHISYGLVDHVLRLFYGVGRQSAHAYVHSAIGVALSLAIVQETEIVIRGICLGLHIGVLGLVGEKFIISTHPHQFAVVESAIAEQQ